MQCRWSSRSRPLLPTCPGSLCPAQMLVFAEHFGCPLCLPGPTQREEHRTPHLENTVPTGIHQIRASHLIGQLPTRWATNTEIKREKERGGRREGGRGRKRERWRENVTELSKMITSSSVGCLDGSQSKAIVSDKHAIPRRLLICGSLRLSAVRVRRGHGEARERVKNNEKYEKHAVYWCRVARAEKI